MRTWLSFSHSDHAPNITLQKRSGDWLSGERSHFANNTRTGTYTGSAL
jgi:hypothetical protein